MGRDVRQGRSVTNRRERRVRRQERVPGKSAKATVAGREPDDKTVKIRRIGCYFAVEKKQTVRLLTPVRTLGPLVCPFFILINNLRRVLNRSLNGEGRLGSEKE